MVKKDKIFELKIEEDDELSGVDAVSLVDEPAIEINWVAFNKTQEDFIIPDGEDMKFSSRIIEKGQSEEELFNDGWEMVKEEFVSSSPNSPSFEDTEERLIRYKYVLNPQAPGAPIKETTREFCKDLLQKNLVYRVEDLEAITNDLGSSAMVWRGSYNCRHLWQKIEYRRGTRIINKGSNTTGRIEGAESYDVMGEPQPDTRVPGKASFKSLPYFDNKEDAEKYAEKIGCKGSHEHIMDDRIFYMPCEKHPTEFGYDNPLPSYVDEVSGDTISKSLVEPTTFESYNDYPEAAKNNACKVLRWRDEHGDEVKGMTQVGWTRANQLCKGENISEETIARMASFARHRENAEVSPEFKSTPWKDKGYVAWLGWGGTTGIEWAQNKLESIRNNMSKQRFQIDSEEKRIVLGPAMIPDQKIFRKDAMGNPYYVFFTKETIRMIAEKYMKNQYTRNNDLMHDGEAVRDVYVIESWIKEDENDKSVKYGYEVPVGSWMIAMKIAKTPKGDEVWKQVKEGKLNGFSVSGFFEEVEKFSKEEMFLYKVSEILRNIKDDE